MIKYLRTGSGSKNKIDLINFNLAVVPKKEMRLYTARSARLWRGSARDFRRCRRRARLVIFKENPDVNRVGNFYHTMNIYQIKHEYNTFHFILVILTFAFLLLPSTAQAVVDPLSSPNNKFGVHIISASPDETKPAADLTNSNGGDWGYITVLIESRDRNHQKWQAFFDDLRRRHLIPLVRLATQPEGGFWKLPYEGEEVAWADFLDNLNWPAKNRYIIVYNEPNQGQEWAGRVDAKSYALVLDKTITALKNKNPNFFVLNAGLDASAPEKLPQFQDELTFLRQMEEAIPGIFNKLDGWTSHSYPNPGFAGSPDASGRGTVRTWIWEMQRLREFSVTKNLPVFITETGWKHAEGLNYDKSLPSAELVGNYFQKAFLEAWNSERIVAVTPFLLNYQEAPFDHFSFKKITGEEQNLKILGASYPDYYPHYLAILDLKKEPGRPVQENKALLKSGEIYSAVVTGESYTIPLTFKNTGQAIWNEYAEIQLKAVEGASALGIEPVKPVLKDKIEPGGEATFNLQLKPSRSGTYTVKLQLFEGEEAVENSSKEFLVSVKSPVSFIINAALEWKSNFSGEYLLSITSELINKHVNINLDNSGKSDAIEARYLLPDQKFNFTLYKPYYKPKTINLKVRSGINNLYFGTMEPNILSTLFKPRELWKLLPFSK